MQPVLHPVHPPCIRATAAGPAQRGHARQRDDGPRGGFPCSWGSCKGGRQFRRGRGPASHFGDNHMATERTLSIIKPDATKRNLTGKINAKFEEAGLRIVAQKRIQLTKAQAGEFYKVHAERPFYDELSEFMASGPVVVQVLEGEGAICQEPRSDGRDQPRRRRIRHRPRRIRRDRSARTRSTARTPPRPRRTRSRSSSRASRSSADGFLRPDAPTPASRDAAPGFSVSGRPRRSGWRSRRRGRDTSAPGRAEAA